MTPKSNKPLTEKQRPMVIDLQSRWTKPGKDWLPFYFTAHQAFPEPTQANRVNRLMLNGLVQKGYLEKNADVFSLTEASARLLNELHAAEEDAAHEEEHKRIMTALIAGKHLFAKGYNGKNGAIRKTGHTLAQGFTFSFSRFPKPNPDLPYNRTSLNHIAESSIDLTQAEVIPLLSAYAPVERWGVRF